MRMRIGHADIPCSISKSMGVAEIVRDLLATGMNQEELARAVEVKQPQVSRWLDGSEPRGVTRDKLFALAKSKGIAAASGASIERPPAPLYPPQPEAPKPGDRIPVMGTAEGGEDGFFLLNGETVDWVARPPVLAGANRGYAIYATGTSMEPRYYAGETLYIHPGKPVVVGSFVVVEVRPKADGDPPRAFIAKLERRTGTKWVFGKLNPQRQIEVVARDVVAVHKIVGSGD